MPQLLTNNASALLAASIAAVDTTLAVEAARADLFPVGNTTDFANPLNWFKATLEDSAGNIEIVRVGVRTAASGTMSTLLRGQDGTTARAFATGSIVELRLTAADLSAALVAARAGANTDITSLAPSTTINGQRIGYRDVPQRSIVLDYAIIADDEARHIFHPGTDITARTITIPANAAVPFAIGAAITIVNQHAAGVLTIAITTDAMRLAGQGTLGSRALSANGVATILKVAAAEWIISGTGLS